MKFIVSYQLSKSALDKMYQKGVTFSFVIKDNM